MTEIVQNRRRIQKLNTFLLTSMLVFGSTFSVQIKCHSKILFKGKKIGIVVCVCVCVCVGGGGGGS